MTANDSVFYSKFELWLRSVMRLPQWENAVVYAPMNRYEKNRRS